MISSSDSEDDCYSNIALKLEKLKNNYKDDKIESSNLLDDSIDLNTKGSSSEGKSEKEISHSVDTDSNVLNEEDVDDMELEKLLATSSFRRTRSSVRKSKSDSLNLEKTPASTIKSVTNKFSCPPRGRGRKRKTSNNTLTSSSVTNINSPRNTQTSRGRRGRTRGGICPNIPIYSVGNTEEYPDQSENVTLFGNNIKSNDVVFLDDSDVLDENEELSVKVYWQSSEISKFTIRRFQKLSQIFKHFSEKENVSQDKLLLTYNDRILKPDDTPDSINYNIVKFIDGGIITQDVTKLMNNNNKNKCKGIQIKFQCQHLKKPFEITIQQNEKLSLAMMKCAEHLEKPLSKLKFLFDGDSLTGTATAQELELESGECIDVKIIS